MRKSKHLRVDPDTKDIVDKIAREISMIEGKIVPSGEIVSRAVRRTEIQQRLKIGAQERALRSRR